MVIKNFLRRFRGGQIYKDIDPEDIFIDSANLPGYESARLEGRIERPMTETTFLALKIALSLIVLLLVSKLWILGVKDGEVYAQISENNRLDQTVIFANRGVIYDRNMRELAANAIKENESDFAARLYPPIEGLAHVVGYLRYPSRDSKGIYYDVSYRGRDGVEMIYEEVIAGKNGLKLRETDVSGKTISESVIERPQDGSPLVLALDASITEVLYKAIKNFSIERGFAGGTGIIMDVGTGEILALTSYPEYDQNLLTDGSNVASIKSLLNSPSKPFLNRAVSGLYTPGSIIKPIIALAALSEGLIAPEKSIFSSGSITVPNPYDPSKPSIFRDWKAHGWTDMREALAVSSDVYFYSIGGGYGDQKGLGIERIDRYLKLFGLEDKTGIELRGEAQGLIPTPEWKSETFDGDIWRLGDTYITAIGQYGSLVTPIEAVRFIAAVANSGKLVTPSLLVGGKENPVERHIELEPEHWRIVRDGMRQGVTYGTSVALNVPYVEVAAKTGTAEVGAAKKYVHSWSTGFFPYENPRYAFVVVMERGPAANTFGATGIMRQVLDWISIYAPEYFVEQNI